jgi:hypothetical protein
VAVAQSSRTSVTTGKPDRFAYGHLVAWLLFSLLFYFSDQLDRSFRLYLFLVPLLTIPALPLIVAWLAALGLSIWRKHGRYLFAVMVAPMLLVGTIAAMRSGCDSDWLRFQLFGWRYEQAARTLHEQGGWYREWNWGDTGGVAVANIFHKLVYDETNRTSLSELSSDSHSIEVRPLGRHFYLVTEIYQ